MVIDRMHQFITICSIPLLDRLTMDTSELKTFQILLNKNSMIRINNLLAIDISRNYHQCKETKKYAKVPKSPKNKNSEAYKFRLVQNI